MCLLTCLPLLPGRPVGPRLPDTPSSPLGPISPWRSDGGGSYREVACHINDNPKHISVTCLESILLVKMSHLLSQHPRKSIGSLMKEDKIRLSNSHSIVEKNLSLNMIQIK